MFGGHADSPVDNPQGGADIVVAQGFLDGLYVAAENRRGVCLAPWAEGGGEVESSHSFSHSPSQAWRIRRVMAVEMDSPFWPLFPPRVLMLENNNRSKKKKRYVAFFLGGSFAPGGAVRDTLSQLGKG